MEDEIFSCSVPLCDIREYLPLSDSTSLDITKVASILLKAYHKYNPSANTNSLKKKLENPALNVSLHDLRKFLTLSERKNSSLDITEVASILLEACQECARKNSVIKGKDELDSDYESKSKVSNSSADEKDELESNYEGTDGSYTDKEDDEPDVNFQLSAYEKLQDKRRKEKLAFLKSLEIDKIKADFSETVRGAKRRGRKKGEKHPQKVYPASSRRSARTANVIFDYSEEKLTKDVWGKVGDLLFNTKRKKAPKRSKWSYNDYDFVPSVHFDIGHTTTKKRSTRLADKGYDFSEFFD